jgi:rhamnose utilization protein RhaD (predicted bifunctional aldolase and dehydrogenase)
MSDKESILQELVALSHHLGEEGREYVVVGEGNTSARIDTDTFWIKTSGSYLSTLKPDDFVQVNRRRVLMLLDGGSTDEDVTRALMEARVKPDSAGRPSVETTLHAVLYELTEAQCIGHTHPTAVNIIVCSEYASDITRHLIPDEIVVCGAASVWVPYTDPGVPLTREVYARVKDYIEQHHESPRVIYLQNHGMLALGQSARQVQNVTAMAVKHARVLAGALALGEPHWLSERDVARLHTRPDEEVRRAKFK